MESESKNEKNGNRNRNQKWESESESKNGNQKNGNRNRNQKKLGIKTVASESVLPISGRSWLGFRVGSLFRVRLGFGYG